MRHARADYNRIQDPEMLIEEDEPVFLLRGKDVVAPAAVMHWAVAAESVGASADIVAAARRQAEAMLAWQKRRGAQIPDMPLGADSV